MKVYTATANAADKTNQNYENWMILILPYVEQDAVFRRFKLLNDGVRNELQPDPEKTIRFQNAAFICPSDSDTDAASVPGEGPSKYSKPFVAGDPTATPPTPDQPAVPETEFTRGSYRGVAGANGILHISGGGTPVDFYCNAANDSAAASTAYGTWDRFDATIKKGTTPTGGLNRKCRGALHSTGIDEVQGDLELYSGEKITNMSDGSSHTIIAGENTTADSNLTIAALNGEKAAAYRSFWGYSESFFPLSSITTDPAILNNNIEKCLADYSTTYVAPVAGDPTATPPVPAVPESGTGRLSAADACKRSFGSFHPGGSNYLYGDGHVEFKTYETDIFLMAALATIEGGEDESSLSTRDQ